jgi:hypothetical protein
MPAAAIKRKPKRKMFHATMLVTRAEEWCVEAASADQARALLAAGEGHRYHLGDCLQIQLDQLHDNT